jgi:hypothetical protein
MIGAWNVMLGALAAAAEEYHYTRPFVQPLYKAWDYWYLLLLPLCLAVAIVYKSIKCHRMSEVPRQATMTFVWILCGIALAAVALAGLLKLM